jgi:abhydrolase domain-containing protein 6
MSAPRRRWRGALLALAALPLLAFGALALRPELALEGEYLRLRLLAGAVEHDVQVGEHRVRYLEAGRGEPLVLVHGFTGSKENWLPLIRLLAPRYRVIAPDLPGWGESTRLADPDTDYGFAAQAQRLGDFLAAVAPGEAVHLVGHSMGGGIAAVWAGLAPHGLRRLVLLDAAGVPFDNDFARRVGAGEHPFAVTDVPGLHRQIDLVFARKPFLPWPADRALAAQRAAQQPFERAVLAQIAGNPDAAFLPGESAYTIQAPTLLLWCREDRVIDAAAATEYARRIRDNRIVLLEGCGHMPMMEVPAETAQALRDFLDR